MIKDFLCKLGYHKWKTIFIGCPANYNGFVEGRFCLHCNILNKYYEGAPSYPRPKNIPMDLHLIQARMPISQMTNEQKQFYLKNLNGVDEDDKPRES